MNNMIKRYSKWFLFRSSIIPPILLLLLLYYMIPVIAHGIGIVLIIVIFTTSDEGRLKVDMT